MKILDASVAIDALRGRPDALLVLSRAVAGGEDLLGSEITRFEILGGMRREEQDDTESFLSQLIWLPIDEVVARAAGAVAREHRPAHQGIDDADCIVAATALVYEAEVLTTNVKHFPMFPDLAAPY